MRGYFFSGVLAATAILAAIPVAQAGRVEQRTAQSGTPTRIFNFFNCTGHVPYQGTAFVDHGTVTYKDGVQSRCGNASEPVREVWYTSAPGFSGEDTVTFPLGGGDSTVFKIAVH